MAGKEEVIASTFEVKDIQKKYDLFKSIVGLACDDFKLPALDLARLTKAMDGGKNAANFTAAWDGKKATFAIQAGAKLIAATRVDVFGDPDRNRRNRMTQALEKLKVMKPGEGGALERQTLAPARRQIDALKKRINESLERIKALGVNKRHIEGEIDGLQKGVKQLGAELLKLEKAAAAN
jgi:hypothetical protein